MNIRKKSKWNKADKSHWKDICSARFGLIERGPTANGWAANSAHLIAAHPARLDRGRRSDPTADVVRASLKRLNGKRGGPTSFLPSPVPNSRRGGGPAPLSTPLPAS
jgi:hypothetical protein